MKRIGREGDLSGRRARASVREGGFTLVEMLVVICIIAILTGLVTIGVTKAIESSRQSNTQIMLDTMAAQLAVYATRWGDFPPSTIADLGGTPPNGTNNGIEAFVACMSSTRRGDKLYVPPDDSMYSNTDADKVGTNLTGWYFGSNDLREITDLYGHVITYLHHKDYAKPRAGVLSYRFVDKGEDLPIKVEQSGVTKTFVNPGRFQIMSVGKDGKPGTPDDIRAGQ
jgi:prepilin-type N-terminal cleavage/methylation domain-containing protein